MVDHKRLALTMLLVAFTTYSATLGDDKAVTDRDALQGAWTITGSVSNGIFDDVDRIKVHYVFEGDKVLCKGLSGKTLVSQSFTLDPGKTPKQMDWGKKVVNQGIYKIEGDTVTICIGPGESRPDKFVSDPGDRRALLILKRKP